jgi:hypothetical protein
LFPSGPHDEFLELCAVSTSGQLSQEDQERLREHLAVCPHCRVALQQYKSIFNDAIPVMAAEEIQEPDPGPSWSQAKAERAFFERLAQEEKREKDDARKENNVRSPFRHILPLAPESTWRHVWMLYAAGMLLFVTLGFCAYWVGLRRGSDVATKQTPSIADSKTMASLPNQSWLEEQLSDAAHERKIAKDQIAQSDRALAGLRRQLEQQSAEMSRMKETQDRLESDLRGRETDKQDLVQQRTDLAQRLQEGEANSQALQNQLSSLAEQSSRDTARAKILEAKVGDLTRLLQDREAALDQQEQLLAHDRDIRELMGARDLYIAEVYDVGDNGTTKKPYGRVFYTRGKSLIFYAYDLDQQGIKRASTFQAWGRRGPDRQQALNLGIFYEDNVSKKRWVLKFDDSKTLAQIDAVFVTLEPTGHSDKPSGKPLLFAFLRVDPNHP